MKYICSCTSCKRMPHAFFSAAFAANQASRQADQHDSCRPARLECTCSITSTRSTIHVCNSHPVCNWPQLLHHLAKAAASRPGPPARRAEPVQRARLLCTVSPGDRRCSAALWENRSVQLRYMFVAHAVGCSCTHMLRHSVPRSTHSQEGGVLAGT